MDATVAVSSELLVIEAAITGGPKALASPGDSNSSNAQNSSTPQQPVRRSGRGANKLSPDPNATGDHTTLRRDPNTGEVIHYEEYTTNPQNPSGYDSQRSYDATGEGHYDKYSKQYVDTPHIQGDPNTPQNVRPPLPEEIPSGTN